MPLPPPLRGTVRGVLIVVPNGTTRDRVCHVAALNCQNFLPVFVGFRRVSRLLRLPVRSLLPSPASEIREFLDFAHSWGPKVDLHGEIAQFADGTCSNVAGVPGPLTRPSLPCQMELRTPA